MNKAQYERANEILMNTLENFKGSTSKGDCEVMVSITDALVKLHTCEIRRESVMGAVAKEDLGRSTVITLRYTGDAEREDAVDRKLLEYLRKIRRKGGGFEFVFKRNPAGVKEFVFDSRKWK